MERFDVTPLLEEEDIRHQFLSGLGTGERETSTGRHQGQVVWTYVVEYSETHPIMDFSSFYTLPSTIVARPRYSLLQAACLYYYATGTAFVENADELGLLKRRLTEIMATRSFLPTKPSSSLQCAHANGQPAVLARAQVRMGRRIVQLLYNWRSKGLAGMNSTEDKTAGRGVGLVML